MAIGIIVPDRDIQVLVEALRTHVNDPIQVFPEIPNPDQVESLLVWKQPPNILDQFPNVKLISSLGAGVDHLLEDPVVPKDVPITRIVDTRLAQAMARYAVGAVLQFHKNFPAYYACMEAKKWDLSIPYEMELRIGVMGMGNLGQKVAEALQSLGFQVYGYSHAPKVLRGIRCFSQKHGELKDFLSRVNTLICLLPLTPETEGILNKELFEHLEMGAYLINLGRGKHLVEEDLLDAIDNGKIAGAYLDVFQQEPLPQDHLFWTYPQVFITPHIASITDQRVAAQQFALNHQRRKMGKPLINRVDRAKGY